MATRRQAFSPPLEEPVGADLILQIPEATRDDHGITAQLRLFRGDKLIHGDRVPLGSDLGRRRFAKQAAAVASNLKPSDVDEPLLKALHALEDIQWGASQAEARDRQSEAEEEVTDQDVVQVDVLGAVEQFLGRYVVFRSEHHRVAVTLWCAHTHRSEAFDSTPRLEITSPEKRSAKTRLLEVMELIVARPMSAVNITPAALYRTIAQKTPTLLLDEVDAIFGEKARNHEDLRALLNAGYRRTAKVYRVVGEDKEKVEAFPAFCPAALAGLGDLPETIADRAIRVPMRRRAPGERVAEFRFASTAREATPLRAGLKKWLAGIDLGVTPAMPEGLEDRAADIWDPLLRIADAAGGQWPARARAAALKLTEDRETHDASFGVQLLVDIRTVFGDQRTIRSAELVTALVNLEDRPWGAFGRDGKPLTQRRLAYLLRPYDIAPEVLRLGETTSRGYRREQFEDPWVRYIPSSSQGSVTSASDPNTESNLLRIASDDPKQVQLKYEEGRDVTEPLEETSIPACSVCFRPTVRTFDGISACPYCEAAAREARLSMVNDAAFVSLAEHGAPLDGESA